jgi:hypothetical protein
MDQVESFEDGAVTAPSSENVEFLTPQKAREARRQREAGFIFALRATGAKAHVRRLFLADRAAIGMAPQHIQNKLITALAEINELPSARLSNGAISQRQALENIGRREELANLACVAGFIRPELILLEADRTSPDQVLVTDIALEDRYAYFELCQGDEEEAKRLKPFPGAAGGADGSASALAAG